LREREAERCATEPAYLVVGADDPFIADKLRLYYQPWMDALQVPYFETDGATAWFVKYATNCAIAGQIAVANELFGMAASVGADYSRFVEVCKVDPEVLPRCVEVPGPDGKRGFGGKCLPKDLKAAVTWGGRWEATPSPLRTIYDYNREVREA